MDGEAILGNPHDDEDEQIGDAAADEGVKSLGELTESLMELPIHLAESSLSKMQKFIICSSQLLHGQARCTGLKLSF